MLVRGVTWCDLNDSGRLDFKTAAAHFLIPKHENTESTSRLQHEHICDSAINLFFMPI